MPEIEAIYYVEVQPQKGVQPEELVELVRDAGLINARSVLQVVLGHITTRDLLSDIAAVPGVREAFIDREGRRAKELTEELSHDPDFQAEVRQLTEDARNDKLPPANSLEELRDRARPA